MPREWSDAFDRLTPSEFEWANLAGLDTDYGVAGIDYRPSHRLGDEWVLEQEANRERVAASQARSPNGDPSTLFRLIIARQLQLATGEAPSALFEPHEVQHWFQGPVDGVSLIAALPTQEVMSHLLYDVHRDPKYRFRQQDRVDILELALTMPYCDVVIPDKHWASHVRGMKLDVEYDTTVLSGESQLKK
ncbi:hypothetical protein [Microbacterium sp. CFBP9034]|uniref:hypothetical protein n=1 Tax=Microbacterium sp. CFBP9034 TaxID=3096540 RepID=UPI002A6B80F5|nr:hypothetical protein [Microbacterium sp. CFBP9034]MDY0910118.1 hypothetical protein [Microbacterium sp. CFBP9034]